MKIEKTCKNEIIQYEQIDDKNFKKTYFDLEGNVKKSKEINIYNGSYGQRYHSNVKSVFEHLIWNEGYTYIIDGKSC